RRRDSSAFLGGGICGVRRVPRRTAGRRTAGARGPPPSLVGRRNASMTLDVTRALPLAGRVIVVTRAREQAGPFAALLEEAGGQVMLVPTISIEPPASWAALDD